MRREVCSLHVVAWNGCRGGATTLGLLFTTERVGSTFPGSSNNCCVAPRWGACNPSHNLLSLPRTQPHIQITYASSGAARRCDLAPALQLAFLPTQSGCQGNWFETRPLVCYALRIVTNASRTRRGYYRHAGAIEVSADTLTHRLLACLLVPASGNLGRRQLALTMHCGVNVPIHSVTVGMQLCLLLIICMLAQWHGHHMHFTSQL